VEELILSGYYGEQTDDGVHESDTPAPDAWAARRLIEETKQKQVRALGVSAEYTQRTRINDWLFQIFEESHTLRSLLRNGNIVLETGYFTSPSWVVPVVELWNIDDAAIGTEQVYGASDGETYDKWIAGSISLQTQMYGYPGQKRTFERLHCSDMSS
jgi:hypothetical protein